MDEERDTGLRHRPPQQELVMPNISIQAPPHLPLINPLSEERNDPIPDSTESKKKVRLRKTMMVGMCVFLSITYALYCVWIYRMSSMSPTMNKGRVDIVYSEKALEAYQSMAHFRNTAKRCRKACNEEREMSSFVVVSNNTHQVWANMSYMQNVHEKILDMSQDVSEFVCSSMLTSSGSYYLDSIPPCLCTISRGEGRGISKVTFLDPHLLRVSGEMAEVLEVVPLLGIDQPVVRNIPFKVEIEYYPILNGYIGPISRLYLEGPDVNTFLHAISFMNEGL